MGYAAWSVVFGEQPSAAKWNILGTNDSSFNDGTGIGNLEIGSGHTAIKFDYKFSVYNSTVTSLAQGIQAKIGLQTKVFDTSSNFDAVTNFRFTAPIAGFYQFEGCVGINSLPNACYTQAILYVNGTVAKLGSFGQNATTISINTYSQVTALLQLNATDYVELWGVENAGGTQSTLNVATATYFMGQHASTT